MVTLSAAATVVALVAGALTAVEPARAAHLGHATTAGAKSAPATADDPVSAQVNARISGHRVEVLSDRTDTTQVYINPDGTVTREVASAPVRVKDETAKDGWSDVDLGLQKEEDGTISPRVPLTDVTLSGGGSSGADVVRLQDKKDRALSLDWDGPLPVPTLDGSTATYADVAPDVDLVVTATRFGFEQSFVIKERPEDSESLELPLTLQSDGLKLADPNASDSSGMTIQDASGRVVGSVSPAVTWDDSTDKSGAPDNHTVSDLTLDAAGDDTQLIVHPDPDYLADPDTVYPVVVDPSFTVGSASGISDTYVRSDFPTTNYVGSTELQVGTYNSGSSISRSYLKFAGTNIKDDLVTSASLKVWEFHSYSCTAANLDVYASTSKDFSASTWNSNQPSLITSPSTKASLSAAKGYSSSCAAGWLTLDVTAATRYWATQNVDHFNYGLRASESANSGWKRFDSSEGSHVPVLTVNYDNYPTTPSNIGVSSAYAYGGWRYVSISKPTLFGVTSDQDGQTARLAFEVTDGSNVTVATCVSPYVAPGTTASCTIPNDLADNGTFYVRAQAQSSYSSMNSGWSSASAFGFRTSLSTPPAPSINCNGYGNGSWTTNTPTSAVSCTVTSPASGGWSAPVRLEISVDGGPLETKTFDIQTQQSFSYLVSNGSGPHTVTAQTYSAVGYTQAAPMAYTFGYGSAGMSSPKVGTTTTNYAYVSASAPPRGNASVTTAFNWRVAGASAWSSDVAIPSGNVDVGTGSGPVTVTNFRWSTLAATGANINPRRPTLLELRVCFTYSYPATTQCTDGAAQPTGVLRVPHAFGNGFPTSAAGEGTLALWSGELAFNTTDVSVAANLATLAVSRAHASFLDAQDGVTGVFGPGWSASFGDDGDATSLQVEDSTTIDGTIAFATEDDDPMVFREVGNGTSQTPAGTYSPVGEQAITSGYTLVVSGSGSAQRLTLTGTDGTVNVWAPVDVTAAQVVWTPISSAQPEKHSTVTYSSDGEGRVTRILAPVPTGVTCGSTGTLPAGCSALYVNYVGTGSSSRVSSITYQPSDQSAPTNVATYSYDSNGRLAVATDARLGLSTSYEYASYGGNVVVTKVTRDGYAPTIYNYDYTNSRLRLKAVQRGAAANGGSAATSASFVYGAPVGTSGLPDLSATQVAQWGQARVPTAAYAVFGMDHPVSSINAGDIASSDWQYATLHFTDDDGYETNFDEYGAGRWLTTALFYDDAGRLSATLNPATTYAIAMGYLTDLNSGKTITRWNSDIRDAGGAILVPAHTYIIDTWGLVAPQTVNGQSQQRVRVHTHYDYDEGAPNSNINSATGKPYLLPTTVTVGVTDPANVAESAAATLLPDVQIISVTKNGYDPIDGASATGATSGWTLGKPTTTTTVMPNSADNIVRKTRYDGDGKVLESREPGSIGTDAGTTKSVFYSAGTNTDDAACGNQPKWAGLVCWTGPAAPPESGADILDTRVSSYDRWLNPVTAVQTSGVGTGLATRTTTKTYLSDGRLDKTTIATSGLAGSTTLPATRTLYDAATKLPTGVANLDANNVVTSSVTSQIDLWGRTTSYTDASNNTTTTTYVQPGVAGAGSVDTVANAKGSSTYSYDGYDSVGRLEHRGLATGLSISGVGWFAAGYDALRNLDWEGMPGGTAIYSTFDELRRPGGLNYIGNGQTWLAYGRLYNAANQLDAVWDSTGRSLSYGYDRSGRLTSVSDSVTPPGSQTGTCTTRAYGFDARGNRTSLATASGSACTTSGATTRTWGYDAYSRQQTGTNGAGSYVYDAFGRQTTVPASDAANGVNAATTASYYDDDTARTISQSGVTTTFGIDPSGRRLTESTSGTSISAAYSDPSDSPDWVTKTQGSTVTTTRYATDLTGGLISVDLSGGTPAATMQFAAPSGAIAAAVPLPTSGNATQINFSATYDEYGRSLTGAAATGAARYGWQGKAQRQLSDSGLIHMGARLYNPGTGRFTSTDPVPGGNENSYVYPNDPVNRWDPTGESNAPLGGGPMSLTEIARQAPAQKGVYYIKDSSGKSYVGKSVNLQRRLREWAGTRYRNLKIMEFELHVVPGDALDLQFHEQQLMEEKDIRPKSSTTWNRIRAMSAAKKQQYLNSGRVFGGWSRKGG